MIQLTKTQMRIKAPTKNETNKNETNKNETNHEIRLTNKHNTNSKTPILRMTWKQEKSLEL
jgi:hypothetical protein